MPLVSVLIAIYNPNINWLKEQLESINNQTYKNLEIIICDDCPDNYTDKNIFYEMLFNFKSKIMIIHNKKNLGSTKTFEELTKLATGKYIAYCDQDDIWKKNKIQELVSKLEKNSDAVLIYSDAEIINKNNKIIYTSLADYHKGIIFYSGKNLYNKLLINNFVTGCMMLIKSNIAKNSLPFEETMIHDHYLALYASMCGEIIFLDKKLIYYRRHDKNQTGVLFDVKTKKDYYEKRILLVQKRLLNLKARFGSEKNILDKNLSESGLLRPNFIKKDFIAQINKLENELSNRKIWWEKFDFRALKNLLANKNNNFLCSRFEILMARVPNFLFKIAVNILRR